MKRKIIIVDDNKINRTILDNLLCDSYIILQAENGRQALDLLLTPDQCIEAVLLDLVMPVMDGFEFLKQKTKYPQLSNIPVVVMTQSTESEVEVKALSLGAMDFIAKPYNAAVVKQRLHNLFALKENLALLVNSERDSLTGIYNKETFYRKSEEYLKLKAGEKLAVICIDVERFKFVNDLFGTAEGDKLLKYIAKVLDEYFSVYGGVYGRLGSDNFALLMPFQDGFEKRLEARIIKEAAVYPLDLKLTLRFGIYIVQDYTVPVEIMCDRANLAIGEIKGLYQKYYAFYTDSIRDRLLNEQELINDMHGALNSDEFVIYYQPKFDLSTQKMVGAEALVRWNHPEKGLIPPDKFIPLFEKNGFITALDMYVWETTCKNMQRWASLGLAKIPISVNVSRVDIFNPRLCEIICELCDKYNISHDILDLEITETAYTQSPKQLIDIAGRLKALGFRIVMDDFGSGYSSLNMFNEVPVDIIKLDMGFLHGSGQSPLNGNILNFVVNMAKWMNIPVVAEGVETLEQVNFLKSMGCNQGQGYFFHHPLPLDDFEKLLHTAQIPMAIINESIAFGLDINDFWDPDSQFNLLFNIFVGAIVIFERNGENISILRANDKWYDMFGPDRSKIFGAAADLASNIYPADRERFTKNISSLSPSSPEVIEESRWVNPMNGQIMWLRSHVRTIFKTTGRSISIASTEDITASAQTQIHLSEALNRFESITKSIPGGVFRYSTVDGSFDYISDNMYKMLGYTHQEFKEEFKNNFKNLIYEEDRSEVLGVISCAIADNSLNTRTVHRIKTKGGLIWVQAEGSLVRESDGKSWVYVVLADITHQKETENQLRISIRQMDIVFRHSDIDMWRYEMSSKMVTHISGSFEKRGITQRSMPINEFVSKAYIVHPDFIKEAMSMNQRLIDGEDYVECTIKTLDADGSWRWSQIRYNTIFDETGKALAAIGSRKDVNAIIEASLSFKKEFTYLYQNSSNLLDFTVSDITAGYFLRPVMENEALHLVPDEKAGYPKFKIHPEDAENYRLTTLKEEILNRYQSGNLRTTIEYRLSEKTKEEYFWVRCTLYIFLNPENNHVLLASAAENIDQEKQLQFTTKERAEKDVLTGIYNRGALAEIIENQAADYAQNGKIGAFLLLDIDNFKNVNDNFGHIYGDEILKYVSSTLTSFFRSKDVVGRLGGDEIVVFMTDLPNQEVAIKKAESVCKRINEYMLKDNLTHLSCSVGLAFCPDHGDDYLSLYNHSDIALYRAKKQGKSRVVVYNNK